MFSWWSVFSGTVGSVIAGVVTYLVASRTIRRDRERDQEREDAHAAQRDLDRREESAARMIAVLRATAAEVRWTPFIGGHATGEMTIVSMTFYCTIGGAIWTSPW